MVRPVRWLVVSLAMCGPVCGSAAAQDVRGIEICTVEKQVERRTSCLQSNVDFLMQTLTRQSREAGEKFAASTREIAAQKAEIAALKSELAKIHAEFAEFRKSQSGKKQ